MFTKSLLRKAYINSVGITESNNTEMNKDFWLSQEINYWDIVN